MGRAPSQRSGRAAAVTHVHSVNVLLTVLWTTFRKNYLPSDSEPYSIPAEAISLLFSIT